MFSYSTNFFENDYRDFQIKYNIIKRKVLLTIVLTNNERLEFINTIGKKNNNPWKSFVDWFMTGKTETFMIKYDKGFTVLERNSILYIDVKDV